jgi:hypothetical protein
MVRAILDGRKTMTRRVVKPQPLEGYIRHAWYSPGVMGWTPDPDPAALWQTVRSPYGKAGDRLWVKEAWRVGKGYDDAPGSAFTSPTVWYEADGDLPLARVGRYRHARFMPRWASRITLEVTGVRVERLQDISEEDARAEGAPCELAVLDSVRLGARASHRAGFTRLWDSINGAGSWDTNPWVWVVEFSRIEQGVRDA